MSQEETMKLVAELSDKISGPWQQMMKTIKGGGDTFSAVHKTGAQQAREHAKAYRELHESIRKIKDTAVDVVQPGLAAMGVTTLSIAAAVDAVFTSVKSLGEAGQTLEFTARRSGALTGHIRALQDAGERFGISQEQTNAGLAKFGEFMDKNARRAPDALNAWNQMPGAWARIGKELVSLNRDAQIDRVLDFIPKVKYMDQRRKLLSIMGLPEDWATLTKEESIKIRAAGEEFNRLHPLAVENARKSKEAWDAVASSFKGIKEDMGAAFGPDVVRGFKAIHEFLDDKATIGVISHEFEQIARSVRDTAAEIAEIMGYAKTFNEWRLGTNKKPEEKSEVVPPMNRWWNNLGVKDAITQGFLEALRQQNTAGTYSPMAFHPGGGSSGARGGGGYFGSKEYPAIGGSAGDNPISGAGKSAPDTSGVSAYAGGAAGGPTGESSVLQTERARFADELKKNPQTRKELAALTTLEGNPANVTESLMNRMAMTGGSLHSGMHGGRGGSFYGPIRRGQLPGAMAALERNPKRSAQMDAAIESVLRGRNVLKGATDQGMASDPNGRWLGGRVYGQDQVYNDWGGGPGGHEGSRRFREAQQRRVAEGAAHHGASLRDHIRHGRKNETDGSLLTNGRRSDAALNGSASLTIDLNGFPRGTRTASKHDGLFKDVTLNRGRQMSPASDTA